MDFPRFTLQEINQRFQERPTLQMRIVQQKRQQGVSLSITAKGVIQPSFILGVVGNPGAGKSTIVEQFLLNQQFYGKKFERVLFIGPTLYSRLVQDNFNTSKQLDLQWIYSQIQQCKSWRCKSLLIVMDDIVSSLKNFSNPDFVDLFYNRRHLLKNQGVISFIVTSQKWNLVPTFIRSAYNMLILFPIAKQQQQIIAKEVSLNVPRKLFVNLVGNLKKYQFIYINLQSGTIYDSQWRVV